MWQDIYSETSPHHSWLTKVGGAYSGFTRVTSWPLPLYFLQALDTHMAYNKPITIRIPLFPHYSRTGNHDRRHSPTKSTQRAVPHCHEGHHKSVWQGVAPGTQIQITTTEPSNHHGEAIVWLSRRQEGKGTMWKSPRAIFWLALWCTSGQCAIPDSLHYIHLWHSPSSSRHQRLLCWRRHSDNWISDIGN